MARSDSGVSATANPAQWPQAASPASFTDAATEARISRILENMTLEQKVAQLIQADISAITPGDLKKYPLGSILAGGNSGPFGNERGSAADWARMVDALRAASMKSGAKVPILFGVDAVHGHSNLPGATIFPHNIGLGAARDPELVGRTGEVTAVEIAASGIDWTFAPTLAVPQDLRWGRSYEGYSADPALVAAYSKAMTVGLQGVLKPGAPLATDRVAATAKHYLADGGTDGGKDQGDARISESELVARHAQGYPAAIDAGALTVMASFSSWNGVKNHGNRSLLTDVLKGRMGFAGLVVGDWNGHGQLPGCTATDCAATFNAGLDLAMAPDSWKGLYKSTLRHVRKGTIPMARIDDAARRVLRVKAKLGLLDIGTRARPPVTVIGSDAHLAVAREAVAKSLVLLKNNNGVLPIKPGARVAITGPGADNMAMQAGGWTITWQGTDTKPEDFPNGQTIGRALKAAVEAAGGSAVLGDGEKPDVAIVVYGEYPYAEFQGDVPDLAFRPLHGEESLIASLKAQGIPVVSLFLSGRPLFTGKLINMSDAFVAAWLPGTQGIGVADVLIARKDGAPMRDFTGRLPFPWPDDANSPIVKPLFPEGYGLDYKTRVEIAAVNESPRADIAAARSEDSYVLLGKVPQPWRLGLDATVTVKAVDLSAQEDAVQFTWSGAGSLAIDGPAVNLARKVEAGFALKLDWRVDARGSRPLTLAFAGGELRMMQKQGVAAVSFVPLRCFAAAGAKFDDIRTPLRITAGAGTKITVRGATIEQLSGPASCPSGGK